MIETIRRWQYYNPDTHAFDRERTTREYARLIGVSESMLSHVYAGRKRPGGKVIIGLLRVFPAIAAEFAR